jgi:hypothetical protein
MEPGDPHTAALIADLDRHDKPALRAAVEKLIFLAGKLPHLREVLNRRLAETGHWPLAYVLGHLPHPSPAALQTLLNALDHGEPDIRWAIALLLGRIARENNAADLINALTHLCATGTINQRRMALYVIRDLSLTDAASLTALLTALRDLEPSVRVAAAISLKPRSDIGDDGKNLLLEAYLHDAEPRVRHTAAITLAGLGAPQPEFVAALIKNRESKDAQTKKAAIAALELLEKRRSASPDRANDR